MAESAELAAAVERFRAYVAPGMARMAELSGTS
jgi:hypothetical protein